MKKRLFLSELEEMVLRAILLLRNDAYGVEIRDALVSRTGRNITLGSMYACLERLEDKGYISGKLGEKTEERGGKAKRYYSVEGAGIDALSEGDSMRENLRPVKPAFGLPSSLTVKPLRASI